VNEQITVYASWNGSTKTRKWGANSAIKTGSMLILLKYILALTFFRQALDWLY